MNLRSRQTFRLATMLVAFLALASNAHAKTAEELTIALDTIWVVLTAALVFFMNLGFALVESGDVPVQEHRQHPLEELHRLRRVQPGLLPVRLGPDVRQRQRIHGQRRPAHGRRSGQQPRHRRCLHGRLQGHRLDGHSAEREVLLSARLRRHRRDHRVRVGRRAHQVLLLHRLLISAGRLRVSHHRPLDLGRRLAGDGGLLGFRRIDGRA